MELRITSSNERPDGGSASRWLLALVIGAVFLFVLAPGATGGAGDYPQPLYLTNAASTNVPASHRLLASGGPGALAAPGVSVQAGSGMTIGSYTYVYTLVDPTGGETAPSLVSATATTSSGNQQVVVSGLPATGEWRLYRRRSTFYFFVAEQTDTPSYTDSTADPPSATVLPQAQNRLATAFSSTCTATTCGWLEFVPGVPVTSTTANGTPSTTAPTAPSGKGWMVDDSGSVHFAQGDWSFPVQTKNGGASTSGTAHLVVGMWKVTTAGAAVGAPIIDPATAGEETSTNLIDTTNAAKTVTHTIANVPAFSLASGERLYVQFWRRQTVPYVNNFNNDSRIITLFSFDGVGRISHPSVSTLPAAPTLSTPADGSVPEPSTPLLEATFNDPDAGDTGAVDFRVCTTLAGGPGSDCADTTASGSSASVANGSAASWTVSPALAQGTYWWQARAQDALGGQSGWSGTRSFTVDQAPDEPTLWWPPDGVQTTSGSPALEASYADPDGDAGSVDFRICTTLVGAAGSDCADVAASGSASSLASGTLGTWAVSPLLPHGKYFWQARAVDTLGASSGWAPTRSVTVNSAPARPSLTKPAAGAWVRTGKPTLRALFNDPDGDTGTVHFRVCTKSSAAGRRCSGYVQSGTSASVANDTVATWTVAAALGDRIFHWQARSRDDSGARSSWSATRRLEVAKALIRVVSPASVDCAVGSRLTVRLRLAETARIRALFRTRGRLDYTKGFGRLHKGVRTVHMMIPYTLERPARYWVTWEARTADEVSRSSLRIDLRRLRLGEVDPPPCVAA
jgi:hypothetical protein